MQYYSDWIRLYARAAQTPWIWTTLFGEVARKVAPPPSLLFSAELIRDVRRERRAKSDNAILEDLEYHAPRAKFGPANQNCGGILGSCPIVDIIEEACEITQKS